MVVRIIGIVIGILILLYVLLLRGLPVLFFIKMLPLLLLLFVAIAFAYKSIAINLHSQTI